MRRVRDVQIFIVTNSESLKKNTASRDFDK